MAASAGAAANVTIAVHLPRNSAALGRQIRDRGHAKDGLEKTMNAIKPTEQSQDSRRRTDLDDRYGEIGISAVAAAIRCKGEERSAREPRSILIERD